MGVCGHVRLTGTGMSYVAGHPAGVDECFFVWFVRAPWSVFAEVAGTYFLCSRRFAHGGVYIVEGRRDVLCIYDSGSRLFVKEVEYGI
ncbi:hypothetical protein EVAR_43356_1 [Eumeta japonica]|uniref:Uncharacterized protein n=1 Tax=Eumeta variegata TaxID=151549 RepID=A0A4C1WQD2_EUMVA|nr:hypothetical protein EVAR_43356_1 [Eumeta japonica]